MSALLIVFSLIIGYLFFMMSFYLLAKVLFPKMEQTPEEDGLSQRIEVRKADVKRLSTAEPKAFQFGKQPQVA